MYITLKELRDKLESVQQVYGIQMDGEVIRDAWVADENDRRYPPGTILFECTSRNLKATMTEEDIHILSIYPEKLGVLN